MPFEPARLELLSALARKVLWLSSWTIHHANHVRSNVDGHPDDRGLAFALEELKFFSREFRIVGVYPGHPFRATFSGTQD